MNARTKPTLAAAKPAAGVVKAELPGTAIGKNIHYTVEGDMLTIRVDLSERYGPSASGKTIIVASSEGNQKLDGTPVVIGFNAYVKP